MCKTDRSAGESSLHLQLRISLELCEVLGRMYRERKISFKALSQPQDWQQAVVALPDLSFSQMYVCPYKTCFSAIMKQGCGNAWGHDHSKTVLGTDLIQSSETVLNHNCQQIAFTWWRNSQRAAHKITSSGVLLMEEREGTKRFSVQQSSSLGRHLVHNTMGTVTSMRRFYLSYDIWDGGTSHQETVLVFQQNPSMGPCLKKAREKFGKWLWYSEWFQVPECCFLVVILYANNPQGSFLPAVPGVNLGKH